MTMKKIRLRRKIGLAWSVAHEPANLGKLAGEIDRGYLMLDYQYHQLHASIYKEYVRAHIERGDVLL